MVETKPESVQQRQQTARAEGAKTRPLAKWKRRGHRPPCYRMVDYVPVQTLALRFTQMSEATGS